MSTNPYRLPPWELQNPLSFVWDILKMLLYIGLVLAPWFLMMFLMGCAVPLTTGYLDEVAVERARYMCLAASVPVPDLPACIQRDVASRRSTQWFGAWSPL